MNTIRRNQFFQFWMPNQSTHDHGRTVEEIWVNQSRQITYRSSHNGQTLVEKVSLVNSHPVLTYAYTQLGSPRRSPFNALLGADSFLWADDFWWDLETSLAAASRLGDEPVSYFGKPVSADLEDDNVIDAEIIHVKPSAKKRWQQIAAGLRRWWRDTSQKTRHWAQQVGDHWKNAIG